MFILTSQKLRRIKEIIRKYHLAMVQRIVGLSALAKEEVKLLRDAGLIEQSLGIIRNSYLFGRLLGAAPSEETKAISVDDFRAYMKKRPLALTQAEQRAVEHAETKAADTIQGLGNRIAEHTERVLAQAQVEAAATVEPEPKIEIDAELEAETKESIREELANAIAERKTAAQLKISLGHISEDWARDWDRIAVTEMHTAHQVGLANHYASEFGEDEYVFKRPMPGACSWCIALHIGPDGAPRIFKLSTLQTNGQTNAGRRRAEWKAVVGSTHPWCRCVLGRVPAGWGFNEEGTLVPGGTLGVRYEDEEGMERAVRAELDLKKAKAATRRLTIPFDLEKSSLHPSIGAATSPAGNRAVDTGSSGLNVKLKIEVPKRKRGTRSEGGYSPDYTDLEEWVEDQSNFDFGTRRDREDYELQEDSFRVLRPMLPFDERFEAAEQALTEIPDNREILETKQRSRAKSYKNKAPKAKKPRRYVAELVPPPEDAA